MLLTFNRNGQLYQYVKQQPIMLFNIRRPNTSSPKYSPSKSIGTTLYLLVVSACFNLFISFELIQKGFERMCCKSFHSSDHCCVEHLYFSDRRDYVVLHLIIANRVFKGSQRAVFHCLTICEGFIFSCTQNPCNTVGGWTTCCASTECGDTWGGASQMGLFCNCDSLTADQTCRFLAHISEMDISQSTPRWIVDFHCLPFGLF